MNLSKLECTDDTALVNMVKKDATKIQDYIAPHAIIRTRNFIIVMGFPGLVQRQGLTSWNINILCHILSVDCCVCIPFVLYFTC